MRTVDFNKTEVIYEPLTPWDKIGIMTLAGSIVSIACLMVICFVCPGCFCFLFLQRKGPKREGSGESHSVVNDNEQSETIRNCSSDQSALRREKFSQKHFHSEEQQLIVPPPQQQQQLHYQLSKKLQKQLLERRASADSAKFADYPFLRQESNLSNMSGSSSSMSISSALSALSFRSGHAHSQSFDFTASPVERRSLSKEKSSISTLVYGTKLVRVDDTKGILHIYVEEAKDLPLRDYGATCDSLIHVSLFRDRRSLRKRSKHVMEEWTTDVIKRDLNPKFSQHFNTEVNLSDFKTLRLKFSAIDCDRYTKTSDIGSCSVMLKDIKPLSNFSEERCIMTSHLSKKKQEIGELLLGMSYLPTAQRLTFNIMKACNLKIDTIGTDMENFNPYVRIIHLSCNGGKIVRRRKTNPITGSKEPVFNETLNFELSPNELETSVFLVLISHRQSSVELQEVETGPGNEPLTDHSDGSGNLDSRRSSTTAHLSGIATPTSKSGVKDICLGRVSVGSGVRTDKGREHWSLMLQTPRKLCTMWHDLM